MIKGKVLVVEDEESLRELLCTIIEDLGHHVYGASNGKQALRILETEKPALVISDVMMPVMDGYTLLENIRLRNEWKFIKVILISAAPINRLRAPWADAYVSKPYNIDGIEHLVEQFVDA